MDDTSGSLGKFFIGLADAIALLGYLFSGTTPPPFPDCGIDPTVDALECDSFAACP
ncbi:MAG: hypothetical protein ABGY15_07150 [bacterium]